MWINSGLKFNRYVVKLFPYFSNIQVVILSFGISICGNETYFFGSSAGYNYSERSRRYKNYGKARHSNIVFSCVYFFVQYLILTSSESENSLKAGVTIFVYK